MRRSVPSAAVALMVAPALHAGGVNPEWSIARQWNEEALQAIRLATPRTPIHSRNLYHLAATLYDGWATYDATARGVYFLEKHASAEADAARRETISYAAYRVLKARFGAGNGSSVALIHGGLDALFAELGYDAAFASQEGDSPAAIGNRLGAAVIAAGLADGANEAFNYATIPSYVPLNDPQVFFLPASASPHPDRWQPLAFDVLYLQSGLPITFGQQVFTGSHWEDVAPFSLRPDDRNPDNGVYFDQGPPAILGSDALRAAMLEVVAHSAGLDTAAAATIDISPGVHHNSTPGTNDHPGHGSNPVTGEPYAPNVVALADYLRVAAEHWFDSQGSSTSAGHWHEIANQVADSPEFPFRFEGSGTALGRLEWDVKMFLAIAGAAHDATIAAWSAKREHESGRPVTVIRQMGLAGQCSDPRAPSFSPDGLPLHPDLVRVVEPEDVAPGGPLEGLTEILYEPLFGDPAGVDDHVGDVVVRSWLGGLVAGAPVPTPLRGPLPGHILRTASEWHIGGFELGDDSPGTPNPDSPAPAGVQLSEVRLGQPGADGDEHIELAGPPGTTLAGLWITVIGCELQSLIWDPHGRIQLAVDLAGHAIGATGAFVVAPSTLAPTRPDLAHLLDLKELSNCTIALVSGFTGFLGQNVDINDDGTLEVQPWTAVIDSVSLRRGRNSGLAGLYFGSPILGPDAAAAQRHGVDWVLADRWMPYQPSNFLTPPHPGFVAESSAIGRACAEALSRVTGSTYFPGGLASATWPVGSLDFEFGPSAPVTLQWASYFDAADEAGESRMFSGAHTLPDDLAGRAVGAACGARAFARAAALFAGLAQSPDLDGDGAVGGGDLGLLLAQWGEGGGSADLDGSGAIDGADLGALLAAWE